MKSFIEEVITDLKLSRDNETLEKLLLDARTAPLIVSIAICSVISWIITTVYSTTDTYFVSQLGVSESAAVCIVYSLMSIILVIGGTLGMGAACNISRAIGAKEYRSANFFATTSICLSFFITTIFAVVVYFNVDAFLIFIGSTPTILPKATDYAKYILLGAPFMAASYTLDSILRAEGHSTFALVGMLFGGVLNLVLDPIFVLVLGWGTKGAAIGTAIGQISGSLFLFWFVYAKKSIIRFSFKYLNIFSRGVLWIFALGLPTTICHGFIVASSIVANTMAKVYGDNVVAAMGIVGQFLIIHGSIMIGLGNGMAPVVGFNYGCKRFRRVLEAYFTTMKLGFCITIVASCLVMIFAPRLIAFFNNDPHVVKVGAFILRCQVIFILFAPITTFTDMLIQYLGFAKTSLFLALLNKVIVFIPIVVILPKFYGLFGLEIAQPVTYACTIVIYIPVVICYIRYLQTLEKNHANFEGVTKFL